MPGGPGMPGAGMEDYWNSFLFCFYSRSLIIDLAQDNYWAQAVEPKDWVFQSRKTGQI
jgi:hypothetical protein